MLPFMMTDDTITVMVDGRPITIDKDNSHFNLVKDAIYDEDWERVKECADKASAVVAYTKSIGSVTVEDGVVYYDGEPMHNSITSRILNMMNEGAPFEHMMRFLDNLKRNPSRTSVMELYGFLEKSELPITERGTFLAFRNVRSNFTDHHTGRFDNSPGSVVEMPRNEVDEDRNNSCSYGLHFCSKDYTLFLRNNRSGINVVVEIDPADVVSIPLDYNESKGRCCRFKVLGVLEDDPNEAFKGASVVHTKDYSGNENWKSQRRDRLGRFTS